MAALGEGTRLPMVNEAGRRASNMNCTIWRARLTVESVPPVLDVPTGRHWKWILSSILLWPAGSLAIDLLGELGLNSFAPRQDFGLWVSDETIPVFYLASVCLLLRGIAVKYGSWGRRISASIILIPIFTIAFLVWTFLTFPFGRVCENW